MFSKATLVAATLCSSVLIEAHLIMVEPVPYNFQPWDNSPLTADGSNFPCKVTGDYTITQENQMVIGEPQELHFDGSATHGGGSCQISITSDRAPTKDTKWSVLKSYVGGCMDSTSSQENIGNNAKMATPFVANITIPDTFEPGKYTVAWTWFNRIGNREMYMNCAPVTVTGGSSSKRELINMEKRASDYPDMFVANINGCQVQKERDIWFPNPGNDVEHLGLAANLLPTDGPVCLGTPKFGAAGMVAGSSDSGSGSGSSSETSTTSAPAAEPTASLPVAAPQPTFTTTTTSDAPVAAPTTTAAEPTAPASTSASPSPSSSGSSGSFSGALSGPCTDEGTWNCIDGTSFQRCASGAWTPTQPVAEGTECTAGQSADFVVKATNLKPRMLKEMRFRRRAHGGHIHA